MRKLREITMNEIVKAIERRAEFIDIGTREDSIGSPLMTVADTMIEESDKIAPPDECPAPGLIQVAFAYGYTLRAIEEEGDAPQSGDADQA